MWDTAGTPRLLSSSSDRDVAPDRDGRLFIYNPLPGQKKVKNLKASRLNLMMFIKKQMTKGNKTSKTKGSGKTYGKKPTKPPKKKTYK